MTMSNMLRRLDKLEVETPGSGAVRVVFARDDESALTSPPGLDQKVIIVRFVRPGFEERTRIDTLPLSPHPG